RCLRFRAVPILPVPADGRDDVMDERSAPPPDIASEPLPSPRANQAFRASVAVLAVAGLALLLWQLRPVLLLLFAAALVAIILHAFALAIEKRTRMPPMIALTISALATFGSVFGIVWLFGSEL